MRLEELYNSTGTNLLTEIAYEMTKRIKEKTQQSEFLLLRALFDVNNSFILINCLLS